MADGSQYLQLQQNLLPPGAAWPREDGAALTELLHGFAEEFARTHNRADELIIEADPRSTLELLGDWERVAGLPDPCSPAANTIQERRDALVERLTSRGGQSIAFFIAIATAIGYGNVTITEFSPFRCGIDQCGLTELGDNSIWFKWQVHVPEARVTNFRCGLSQCGIDELTDIDRADDLECILLRDKPGHTLLLFSYEGL